MTSYAQQLANERNARMTRTDIEWFASGDYVFLRDKPDWTRDRTAELAKRAERERQEWLRNNTRPA